MKSKVFVDVLRTQLEKSLMLLSAQFESQFFLLEREDFKVDDKVAYGLQLIQLIEADNLAPVERRIYFRRYHITGSLNDIKATAFSELFDIIIGTFLVNASRTDSKTLEQLSNGKEN